MKSPVLQLCGQRGHLRTEFHFFFFLPKSLRQLITGDLIADRKVMLQLQMKFSLSSMSSIVKEGRPGTLQLSSAEYDQLNYSSC